MDGVGAQARQAPRAESPPARGDGHELRGHRRRRAFWHPLRHHPRRGHAAPQRGRRSAGRYDGAFPQSTAVRYRNGARRRGIRGASTPSGTAAARTRGLVLPAPFVRAGRHRPVRIGGVRRLPGSLGGRVIHRQRHLRRGRLRGGAGGTGAGQRAAEPRSLRGGVRARRSRDRRRAVRERSITLRRRGGPPAPMGAGRLAAASVDSGNADPGGRTLEDAGQPPPHRVGAGRVSDARGRVGDAGHLARDVERLHPGDHRRASALAGAGRLAPPRAWHLEAQPHSRGRPGPLPGRLTARSHDHDADVPGLADE